jgi:hypothetical protein
MRPRGPSLALLAALLAVVLGMAAWAVAALMTQGAFWFWLMIVLGLLWLGAAALFLWSGQEASPHLRGDED